MNSSSAIMDFESTDKITFDILESDVWSLSDGNYSYNYSDNDSDTCCVGQVCSPQDIMKFTTFFLPTFYTMIFILGILGNGLVIAVLLHFKRSWNVTDTFILHLAVADTLLVVTLPFWAVEAVQGWVFGTPFCKIVGATFQVNFYCGIFLLCCISLDRYLSIVHAVQMYSRRKPFAVQASCFCVWAFCILMSIPDLIFMESVKESRQDDRMFCIHFYNSTDAKSWRLSTKLLYHILGFFIPSTVMLFCYSMIMHTLGRSFGQQKQKAMKVILALVLTFFICWTPYNITVFVETLVTHGVVQDSCTRRDSLDIATTITSSLGYMHCCLNPILMPLSE
uniref:C-X-C chemokine receptor type 3 n=1 Tax=Erpetoichthys calabaricus TaxID=27687 RepID=A0A8C4T568_ERPCA